MKLAVAVKPEPELPTFLRWAKPAARPAEGNPLANFPAFGVHRECS